MKYLLSLSIAFIITSSLSAQTTHERIKACITDYIEGTSYNYTDRITNAFYTGSDLFLDGKDNTLRVVPSEEYISWFDPSKSGQFNGRVGTILSIEQFGNIATAKAEILIPQRELRYIDMFILKQINGEWKIISKTANSEKSNKTGERILFITSNAAFYKGTDIRTGNSLSEIVNAYEVFDAAGYTLDFVSPEGGDIPLAYIDYKNDLQMKYIRNNDFMYAISNTKSISEIDPQDYKAVYYVGGGSAMFDVPENESIQKAVMTIYEDQGGIISSVCHGTAGIVNLKTKDGKYLVEGKVICGYPDEYERKDQAYFQSFPFLIGETITTRGGDFQYGKPNSVHMVHQDNVVTGQNNLSSAAVAQKIIELLNSATIKN